MTPRWHAVQAALVRVVRLGGVLTVVTTLCFLSINLLPGDPAQMILGEAGSPEAVAALRQEMGLERPLHERFFGWLGGALHGDLGRSYSTNQPVATIIAERAPITLELIAISQLIAIAAAIPAAVAAASKRGSAVDRGISLGVFTVLSTPSFVVGFILIWIFAVQLNLYPANGYIPLQDGLGQHLGSLFLPALSLAAAPFALYQRILRADLIATYGQEFIQVARAKGVSPLRIAARHAFRPSLLGFTTSVGVTVGTLIGSDVVVETLFSLPGLGAELAHAVSAREYIEVQGLVLVIATAFVLINALVDLIYGFIDPRLRARARLRGADR